MKLPALRQQPEGDTNAGMTGDALEGGKIHVGRAKEGAENDQ